MRLAKTIFQAKIREHIPSHLLTIRQPHRKFTVVGPVRANTSSFLGSKGGERLEVVCDAFGLSKCGFDMMKDPLLTVVWTIRNAIGWLWQAEPVNLSIVRHC